MVRLKSIVPELNLWFGNNQVNNDNSSIHFDFPVLLSQKWRCRDSVIDLLFNECADPSGTLYDGHPYIRRYKTLMLSRIYPYDATLFRRVQTVANRCYVFAADDPNNSELQAAFNKVTPSYIIDPTNAADTIADRAGVQPTKYVTQFDGVIITTGTDQLHQELPDREPYPDPDEPGIYTPGEEIFNFTEEELEMLDYLYYYRTGQYARICCFPQDFYYKLVSPLSKWIYLYLQCYMFNVVNWEYLSTICDVKVHGLLRSMFEKHAQDRIYQFIQKQHHLIWNRIEDLGGNELKRIFEDHTMPCHTHVNIGRIRQEHLDNEKIKIELQEEDQPVDVEQFEFIFDGIILKPGKDYQVINEGTLKDTHAVVALTNKSKFTLGTKYHLMWSCLKLTTPYTREKGFKQHV